MSGQDPMDTGDPGETGGRLDGARELFPGIRHGVFLNAAGGTPLGAFTEAGLRRFEASWSRGHGTSLGEVMQGVEEARVAFARLIGAEPEEIALVHCTKAGEQVVLDGLPALRSGGNVVTNDLHFSGSLHNLAGLKRAGLDVRVVRSVDWAVSLDAMSAAIDDETALVCVTHVSNVNGHVEPLAELAELAHAHGALIYADVIQSAGVVPLDVKALGVDFAACSAYKWLYGTHGAGFLYVRADLQGTDLPDRLFPGRSSPNYSPWVRERDPDQGDYTYMPPVDARRYQPGHVNYLGYTALRESLAFVEAIGVERALEHSVALNQRLLAQIDASRYPCISPHIERSPIVSFRVADPESLGKALDAADIRAALGRGRLRVSPAVYNTEGDIDRLAKTMNEA